jgi:hypothetical protein
MKTILIRYYIAFAILMFLKFQASGQPNSTTETKTVQMKTYVIEREIPAAGQLTAVQLKGISQKSCGVLKEMTGIQWIQSYVAGDKIYCIYKAENEELIRQHAIKGGFPANKITEVANIISPETAK